MKVLVTGAAGFIGSNLVEKLLLRGDTVYGLDNFDDYYDPERKKANLQKAKTHKNYTFVKEDIRNRSALNGLFEEQKFDAVAHLAAMPGVRNAVKYPALYVEVDFNGTQNLMDCARIFGVQNFVFASTSSVYGTTEIIPFIETDACDRPLQPYAAAKRSSEILGHVYNHLYGLNFTATRFFTVYGPRNRPDMMAHLVADSITKQKEIPYYNNGEMLRDWTFVDDITDGLILAINRPLGFEIINLGRGKPILLKEFVSIMERLAGQKANLVPMPKIAADVVRTYADISKAKRLLGYNPQVSVQEGVNAFWQWYKQQA